MWRHNSRLAIRYLSWLENKNSAQNNEPISVDQKNAVHFKKCLSFIKKSLLLELSFLQEKHNKNKESFFTGTKYSALIEL